MSRYEIDAEIGAATVGESFPIVEWNQEEWESAVTRWMLVAGEHCWSSQGPKEREEHSVSLHWLRWDSRWPR